MSYFNNLIKLDTDSIIFNIKNVSHSLVNALRRIILSEIKTLKFRTEPYEKSDVKIKINNGCLHNEFLAHRIGMIPINVENVDDFNVEEYTFKLKVKNDTNKIINITTNDFKVYFNSSGEEKEITDHNMFPEDPITKEHILICILKPNFSNLEEGEEINIECKASISNGAENAGYSPACKSVFYNTVDEHKSTEELNKLIKTEGLTSEDKRSIILNFTNHEKYRHYKTNEYGEPNEFTFEIESIGVFKPENIFKKAIILLKNKIQLFSININANNNEYVDIVKSNTIINALDINIYNEGHTLGNLLQTYLFSVFVREKKKVKYVGYKELHPLKNTICLRIQPELNEGEDINQITLKCLTEICTHIISILNKMEKDWIMIKSKIPSVIKDGKEVIILKKK
jgi:DNA-directed RNA polymerase II subunit RPB3